MSEPTNHDPLDRDQTDATRPLPGPHETRPLPGWDAARPAAGATAAGERTTDDPPSGDTGRERTADPAEPGRDRTEPEWPADPTRPGSVPVPRRRVPMGTLVFGLVTVALGLILLVAMFYDITLSGGTIAISLLVGAGLILIIGGLIAGRRSADPEASGPRER